MVHVTEHIEAETAHIAPDIAYKYSETDYTEVAAVCTEVSTAHTSPEIIHM